MTVGERQRESERVKLLAAGNGAGEEEEGGVSRRRV